MSSANENFVRKIIKQTLLNENMIARGKLPDNYSDKISKEKKSKMVEHVKRELDDFNISINAIVEMADYPFVKYHLDRCVDDLLDNLTKKTYDAKGVDELSFTNFDNYFNPSM